MKLKKYLERQIRERIVGWALRVNEAESVLRMLPGKDIERLGNFEVYLNPLLAGEGEKPVTFEYHGSLEEAIKQAEKRFKAVNNRDDVQASCSVFVRLGRLRDRYEIPRKYWEKFKGK
jgi:hypothetical protein